MNSVCLENLVMVGGNGTNTWDQYTIIDQHKLDVEFGSYDLMNVIIIVWIRIIDELKQHTRSIKYT